LPILVCVVVTFDHVKKIDKGGILWIRGVASATCLVESNDSWIAGIMVVSVLIQARDVQTDLRQVAQNQICIIIQIPIAIVENNFTEP